jgi:hypothetical protein
MLNSSWDASQGHQWYIEETKAKKIPNPKSQIMLLPLI